MVIATIMRDVLKALDYVHRQGGIHRDIKVSGIGINLTCYGAKVGAARPSGEGSPECVHTYG